ncbi:MAG: hypothetical protein QXI91_04000 [Candidatus Bathyarchaeia archaeon]
MEDISTASQIAKIIEFLEDGKWHYMEELRRRMDFGWDEILRVIAFLREYDLVIMDERRGKVKLRRTFQKFLMQTIP